MSRPSARSPAAAKNMLRPPTHSPRVPHPMHVSHPCCAAGGDARKDNGAGPPGGNERRKEKVPGPGARGSRGTAGLPTAAEGRPTDAGGPRANGRGTDTWTRGRGKAGPGRGGAARCTRGTAGTRAGAGGPPDGAPLAELGNDRSELVLANDAFSAARARAPSA